MRWVLQPVAAEKGDGLHEGFWGGGVVMSSFGLAQLESQSRIAWMTLATVRINPMTAVTTAQPRKGMK